MPLCLLTHIITFYLFLSTSHLQFTFDYNTSSSEGSGLGMNLTRDPFSSLVVCTAANHPHLNAHSSSHLDFSRFHFCWLLMYCLWQNILPTCGGTCVCTVYNQVASLLFLKPNQDFLIYASWAENTAFSMGKGEREGVCTESTMLILCGIS